VDFLSYPNLITIWVAFIYVFIFTQFLKSKIDSIENHNKRIESLLEELVSLTKENGKQTVIYLSYLESIEPNVKSIDQKVKHLMTIIPSIQETLFSIKSNTSEKFTNRY
jgi:hypothetical protein